MLEDLVLKNRSYRRFDENKKISMEELIKISNLGRLVPSTANSQALKFMLINTDKENDAVFNTIGWAAKLKDWDGPKEGERPAAYIILLCDLAIGKNHPTDDGIVAQTMLLGAVEMGYGGCMLGNLQRDELAKALKIDTAKYKIDLVIALGKPKEEIILEDVTLEHGTSYYRDEHDIHHVPKRSLEDLIIYKSSSTN